MTADRLGDPITMDRRTLLYGLGAAGILAAPLVTEAQQPGRIWRIGYLANLAPPPDSRPPLALRDGLKELGYLEDKTITHVSRWGRPSPIISLVWPRNLFGQRRCDRHPRRPSRAGREGGHINSADC